MLALPEALGSSAAALPLALGAVFLAATAGLFFWLFAHPSLPKDAPAQVREQWPVLGSLDFFTKRWDFIREALQRGPTKNFTFFVGQYPVVALSGEADRKTFFEHRGLSFNDGYSVLLGGGPPGDRDDSFGNYFQKRLINMLKGPMLRKGLPQMITDVRAQLAAIRQTAAANGGYFDPFATADPSIYGTVFQLTMRAVAANEIADDPGLLNRCLRLFESIDGTATALTIMYPWMPLPAKFRRLKAGAELYMMFDKIIAARKKEDRRDVDALQYLMDQGDDTRRIITFVLGALFAGQLNSGINAGFILCYLSCNAEWRARARAEVVAVADKYAPDPSGAVPLVDRLARVPIDAWENEFPILDLCLKDTIRMHMPGTAFRRNVSGHAIPLEGTDAKGRKGVVIPDGAYVAYPVGDIFYNPSIYEHADDWDPARYLPGRAEHEKESYAWMGWGVARHPCLGMRFAKLENNLIGAFFLATFDEFTLHDQKTRAPLSRVPPANRNEHSAAKPLKPLYLKVSSAAAA